MATTIPPPANIFRNALTAARTTFLGQISARCEGKKKKFRKSKIQNTTETVRKSKARIEIHANCTFPLFQTRNENC